MSCANIVLPVFMIRPSSADARARPTGNQIRPSNDLRKTISDQYFIDNLASANRTAVKKRSKKLSSIAAGTEFKRRLQCHPKRIRVFWFFFCKKERVALLRFQWVDLPGHKPFSKKTRLLALCELDFGVTSRNDGLRRATRPTLALQLLY